MGQGGLVTLWTIQSGRDWHTLRDTERLRRDEGHRAHVESVFVESYEWMREQMRQHIPHCAGRWPIWAWAGRQPPLWHESRGWPFGSRFVRIALAVEERRILRSDFQAWHCVLNGGPVCLAEAESDAWDAVPGTYNRMPEDQQTRIRATWPRIFDLDALARSSEWYEGDASRQDVQVVLEEIRLSDVVGAVPFVGTQWPPARWRRNTT